MKFKNNTLKTTLLLSSIFFVPFLANKAAFFIAQKKYLFIDAFYTYDWRLGKIGYSVIGNGKPVVLIHDAKPGSSSAVWLKNTKSLAESYKVYTIDLLGYGTSERVNTTYTSYTYASMIDDFITDVVKRPAAVIAEGEGAMFAAEAYAKNPKNYKRLVLVCPKGINGAIASNDDKKVRLIHELPILGESLYLLNTTLAAIKNTLHKMIYSDKKTKILTERFYAAAHQGGALNRFPFASYKAGFMNTSIIPYIKLVKVPLLIVWGEKAYDVSNFDKIQGLNEKAEYLLFEETANLPNYENADEFNKAVKEFLK